MTLDEVTVLTPSMPGRERLLAEALASVAAQTVAAAAHLVRIAAPPPEWGPNPGHLAAQREALWRAARTEWVAMLDDDDIWLPHHLETVAPALAGADVVYTHQSEALHPFTNVTGWRQRDLVARLRQGNCINSNALIRRSALAAVGGYPQDFDHTRRVFRQTGCTWEDWAMWVRLAEAGARFVGLPVPTWIYRLNAAHSSMHAWQTRGSRVLDRRGVPSRVMQLGDLRRSLAGADDNVEVSFDVDGRFATVTEVVLNGPHVVVNLVTAPHDLLDAEAPPEEDPAEAPPEEDPAEAPPEEDPAEAPPEEDPAVEVP